MLKNELPKIITESLPGPKARKIIERRENAVPTAIRCAYPVVIERGEGAMIEDVDGNQIGRASCRERVFRLDWRRRRS